MLSLLQLTGVTLSALNVFALASPLINDVSAVNRGLEARDEWQPTASTLTCLYLTNEPEWAGEGINPCEVGGTCGMQQSFLPRAISAFTTDTSPSQPTPRRPLRQRLLCRTRGWRHMLPLQRARLRGRPLRPARQPRLRGSVHDQVRQESPQLAVLEVVWLDGHVVCLEQCELLRRGYHCTCPLAQTRVHHHDD